MAHVLVTKGAWIPAFAGMTGFDDTPRPNQDKHEQSQRTLHHRRRAG